MNRRDTVKTLASAAVATTVPWSLLAAQQPFRLGYAAITWGATIGRRWPTSKPWAFPAFN